MNIGAIRLDQGKIPEAIGAPEKAVAITPDHALALRNLADAYGKAGRYEDGLRVLRRAQELERN